MLDTITRDGKTYANLVDLQQWDKNPKTVSSDLFDKLVKDVEQLGEYKPLVVNDGSKWGKAGVVLGGNSRFMAAKQLERVRVWVSLVSPKDEEEAIAYALSDNEQVGQYDTEALAELVMPYRGGILEQFKVQFNTPASIKTLLNSISPTSSDAITDPVDKDSRPDRDVNAYMNASVKQIIMFFPSEEYSEIMEQVQEIMEAHEYNNVTEVFKYLLRLQAEQE